MKPTLGQSQPANPLFEGLKQLIRDAVREELETLKPSEPPKLLLDTDEAARLLSVPPTWLGSMAREGKIKSIKLGHYVRFARADLDVFIQQTKGEETK